MHLAHRILMWIGLFCASTLALQQLSRALIDAESLWPSALVGGLVAATAAAVHHDRRRGYFRQGRFGPASALAVSTWLALFLGTTIWYGPVHQP